MHEQRVALIIHQRLQIQIRRGRGLPAEIKPLAILRDAAVKRQPVCAGIGPRVVLIIIFNRRVAPLAEVQIDIRPRAHAAPRAVVQMDFSIRHIAEKPGVSVQQIAAVTAAIAGRGREIIRVRPEVALVIRKIKHWHAFDKHHRVPHPNRLAGDDFDFGRADFIRRVRRVVRSHKRIARSINSVAAVARQTDAARKHRRFAGAKLFAAHLARLEIILNVVAHPELVAGLDADIAVCLHVAGLHVHRGGVRREHRAAVIVVHINAVRARRRARGRIIIHLALDRAGKDLIQRLHLPRRLVLGADKAGEKQRGQKSQRGNGGKFSHSARPIKQNQPRLPRAF